MGGHEAGVADAGCMSSGISSELRGEDGGARTEFAAHAVSGGSAIPAHEECVDGSQADVLSDTLIIGTCGDEELREAPHIDIATASFPS